MSSVFYGLNAWLPDAYVERGWSEGSAGEPARRAEHRHDPRAASPSPGRPTTGGSAGCGSAGRRRCNSQRSSASCSCPEPAGSWAVLLGVAIGPLFPLTMTLPLDAAERPAEVAALAGMMLGVGYTLSALSPLLLGAIRDLSGGFDRVLWTTRRPRRAHWSSSTSRSARRGSRPVGPRRLRGRRRP